MPQPLKATYRKGTFVLQAALELPEGCEVELLIQSPQVVSPLIVDVETRNQTAVFTIMEWDSLC